MLVDKSVPYVFVNILVECQMAQQLTRVTEFEKLIRWLHNDILSECECGVID